MRCCRASVRSMRLGSTRISPRCCPGLCELDLAGRRRTRTSPCRRRDWTSPGTCGARAARSRHTITGATMSPLVRQPKAAGGARHRGKSLATAAARGRWAHHERDCHLRARGTRPPRPPRSRVPRAPRDQGRGLQPEPLALGRERAPRPLVAPPAPPLARVQLCRDRPAIRAKSHDRAPRRSRLGSANVGRKTCGVRRNEP